ncbi:MAG: DUF4231 domain-containing protein [Synechococcales bacterium]|nr:DUF4231 domain-containing protein [Synechococcales bacterium]
MISQSMDSQTVLASSNSSGSQPPTFFYVVEFLLIAAGVAAVAIATLFSDRKEVMVGVAASLTILGLLLFLNQRLLENHKHRIKQLDNEKKAELYSSLFGDAVADESINLMRTRAIQYCQELIDDYKNTRRNSRNIYYLFQISSIVFSGVTPILVLLDKVDLNLPWIKWLPVIFPAIASVVTSLSTSFPFQKNWMAANTSVELLEAEQEKFILGVTPAYRFFDLPDATDRKRKVQESVESFITQINTIHLNQVQPPSENESKQQGEMANEQMGEKVLAQA